MQVGGRLLGCWRSAHFHGCEHWCCVEAAGGLLLGTLPYLRDASQLPPPTLQPPSPPCRRAEEGAAASDEAVPWDEEAVYRFLLAYYSGEAPPDAAPASGLRSRRSSWSDAGLLVLVVAACVYALLRRSGQYALKKVHSRSL